MITFFTLDLKEIGSLLTVQKVQNGKENAVAAASGELAGTATGACFSLIINTFLRSKFPPIANREFRLSEKTDFDKSCLTERIYNKIRN